MTTEALAVFGAAMSTVSLGTRLRRMGQVAAVSGTGLPRACLAPDERGFNLAWKVVVVLKLYLQEVRDDVEAVGNRSH